MPSNEDRAVAKRGGGPRTGVTASADTWSSPLYLHVGMPKTATSTLQQIYFARHPEIDYHALARKGGPYPKGGPFDAFVHWVRNSPDLETEREGHRAYLRSEIDAAGNGTHCRLISEERFTGHFGAGLQAKAALAHDLFPEARILLTIRHPVGHLVSNYLQHLKYQRAGQPPLPAFDTWVRRTLAQADDPLSYAQTLRVNDLVQTYERKFGPDKVLVLVYEEFRESPERFLARLSDWLGVEEATFLRLHHNRHTVRNPAPTRPEFVFWYLRQRWVNRGPSRVGAVLTKASQLGHRIDWRPAVRPSPESRALIERFTAPQYRALSQERGLGLEDYGYPGFAR
ncbi:sulfotransferase [Algihabitans albus]|uniref:sulfotransferase n=1 Tax=Algihabitans albus TaxID=2164067 RepID=UPI000E5C73C8|nr:sulfotransferase [Algihabitans albus]